MSEPEEEIMPLMQQLTLSRCAVSMIDPFRDDPPSEDDLDSDVETLETSEEDIASKLLCTCNNCEDMPTLAETLCCQEASRIRSQLIKGLVCITEHPLVPQILSKEMLTINILTLWDATRSSSEINNRNLRFAAYRSLFFWLYKKKGKKGRQFRSALPACLVNLVRQTFPEEDQKAYTGFIPTPLSALKRKHPTS